MTEHVVNKKCCRNADCSQHNLLATFIVDMVQEETEKPLIDWVAFGQWMRKRREGRGLSQEAAAEAIKIHQQTWYRLEKGDSTKHSTMRKIARFLAVDDADLNQILAAILGPLSAPPQAMKEKQEKARRDQASRLSEMIENFGTLSAADQARAIAIIKVLGAEYPETPNDSLDDEPTIPINSPYDQYEADLFIASETSIMKGGKK